MTSEFGQPLLELGQQLGQPSPLQGNQTLLLNDPQTLWIVESGEVAVFRVAIENNLAIGVRRYLFSCETGDVLFSLLHAEEQLKQLLVVPVEPASLLQVKRNRLEQWMEESQQSLTPLFENWLLKWRIFLEELSIEELSEKTSVEEAISHSAILDSLNTVNTLDELLRVNTQILDYLNQAEAHQHVADWEAFQMRERVNHQVTQDTIAALANILKPQTSFPRQQSPIAESTPQQTEVLRLYRVVQAVTQATGITLHPVKSQTFTRFKDPLEAITRTSRLRTRRVLLTGRWWRKDNGSLLAYMRETNRPIALIAIAPGRYQIVDPEQGIIIPLNATNRHLLDPVAYTFYHPLPERPLHALDVLKFGLKGSGKDWSVIVWTGIAIALLGLLLPQGMAILIDQALPEGDRGLLIQLGLGLFAAVFGGFIFQLAQGVALIRIETWVEALTQAAFWDRLLNLNAPFFRQFSTGDLRERVSVISAIRSQVSGAVLRTLFNGLFALLNLVLLFYYGGSLALIACAVAGLLALVTAGLGHLILQQLVTLQSLEGKLFGLMVQLIHGVAKLRVTGAEDRAFAHWGKQYRQQQQSKLITQKFEDTLLVLNQLLPMMSFILLFSITGLLLQNDSNAPSFSTGTFLAFNVAFGSFLFGITDLSNTLLKLLAIVVLWQRAKPILQAPLEVDNGKTEPGQLSGKVVLHHIGFRYRPDGPTILDDVTIEVRPGEFVAIVGPSGSGKSTLFRLLLGFETPQSGQVYYDGQDLRSLNIHTVRRQLGVLLQNSRTSTASIFDNIAGNALITMEEAWEAAHYAGLAEDIEAMPMGMHTVISEGGGNLSGGQRQRLLIARSLALKPRILMFDEATSSLDNRTQAIVSESLERLNITRIVIAHRLSTIQNADRIYVLQAGRIVQQGTFNTLIQQKGLFLQLMQQQIA